MSSKKSIGPERVQQALDQLGIPTQVTVLPESTRTAKEAAQAVGCQVAQIAKSIIFQGKESKQPVLVVASGVNRIDEARIGVMVEEKIGQAKAEFVREKTGYVIGGVPPLAHNEPITTIIDEDLLQYDRIWAAAGTPKAVFMITPGPTGPGHRRQGGAGQVGPRSRYREGRAGQGRGFFRQGRFSFSGNLSTACRTSRSLLISRPGRGS